MKRFIALYYIPGAAGNFLSRCINLLDNAYVWASSDGIIPTNLLDKLNLLSYNNAKKQRVPTGTNTFKFHYWYDFENSISEYYNFKEHWNIESDGIAVFVYHPEFSIDHISSLIGPSDIGINILIDSTDELDWCILNGFRKESFQMIKWFQTEKKLHEDPSVYKIKLSNIIRGYDKFLEEFKKLLTILDRTLDTETELALQQLYNEWYTTTFPKENISAYNQYKSDTIEILKDLVYKLENSK